MAATFRSRNPMYGENWKNVGNVMAAMFPNGITLRTPRDFVRFHFFDWTVGKLCRFVNADMEHTDSVHDAAVYLSMIEAFLSLEQKEDGTWASKRKSATTTSRSKRKSTATKRGNRRSGR
jgi:hypothetical protein